MSDVFGGSYTQKVMRALLTCCPLCKIRQHAFKKTRAGHRPIVHVGTWACLQIDLIDYSNQTDDEWKYVLTVKDHFTRFAIFRPLLNKTHKEVAYNFYGLPDMIHADNGSEF